MFSIFYAVTFIDKDETENWWCSSLSDQIVPLILSLAHFLFITLFLISLKLRIKSIKRSTQCNDDSLESESQRLRFVETEKITSYVFMIWVQLLFLIIYLIAQFTMANSVATGVYYTFALSIGGVLILIQYIRNESLMHGQNQSKIPKLVIDHVSTEGPNVSQINSMKNYFFGRFHSNKNLSPSSTSINSSPRESFRYSFRDSFQKLKLPFTKIQVQVVQHQTSDFSTIDSHDHLEIPVTSDIS
ncbi:23614_t:CDS:2 [Cetraspora pellucida]|uniref:23614_t:CDS:1 n=1 Tax=Cetraspora pellucida TaxID=1433469 RepID=A0A9N9I0T9_9GLOM|nr:23614_t:CDS:2 [Cetraspora pellucida]